MIARLICFKIDALKEERDRIKEWLIDHSGESGTNKTMIYADMEFALEWTKLKIRFWQSIIRRLENAKKI